MICPARRPDFPLRLLLSAVATLAVLAGCALHRQPRSAETGATLSPPAAGTSVPELAAVIRSDADRSEREKDAAARNELATHASQAAAACIAQAPQAAACLYGRAVATGLEARSHPTHASELLRSMLDDLARAEATDPDYDEAGPARVRALVLLRAPAWPLGPGDVEEGLKAAQRAVARRPDYPPNQLALAQALSRNGDSAGARASYAHAGELALRMKSSAERDDWLHEAQAGQRAR